MTWIIDTKSKRRLSAKLAAGLVISAMTSCGGYDSNANSGYYSNSGYYYNAPPVVYGSLYGSSYYGSRYYYTPPVIYPSLNIGIW
jgi:hypothetical protein